MGCCFSGLQPAHGRHLLVHLNSPQETNILELPEDVLLNVMSKLSLRDAINLSFVCKQWSHLPAGLDTILIDIHKGCPENDDSFVQGVNNYVQHYVKLRSKISQPVRLHSFDVSFCFTRRYSTQIDTWISMAFHNGVTSLTVRALCHLHFLKPVHEDEKYIFPWEKLHNFPTSLKSLTLRNCFFGSCLTTTWTSLEFLDLKDMTITQHDMNRIFVCFPNLQKLVLTCCFTPRKLTFATEALTSLKVWYCLLLKKIDLLGAKALTEFNYRGRHINLKRISYPKLTKLKLAFGDVNGDEYVFQNLPGDTVESLSIFRDVEQQAPDLKVLRHGRMNSFIRLTELKLYDHPARGTSCQTITRILEACPVLKRLEMAPSCVTDAENLIVPPVQYRHKCLRFIVITGFCGSKSNVEMAKFIVQIPEELHHVVVECSIRDKEYAYYRGSGWHAEQDPEAVKDMLLRLIKSEQLRFLCPGNISSLVI